MCVFIIFLFDKILPIVHCAVLETIYKLKNPLTLRSVDTMKNSKKMGILLFLLASSQGLQANNFYWIGGTPPSPSYDLNVSNNWVLTGPPGPTDVAEFGLLFAPPHSVDIPNNTTPYAIAPFSIDSFNFSDNASVFNFLINGNTAPAYLEFTGAGITSQYPSVITDTTITAVNNVTLTNPQISFTAGVGFASIGNASLITNNSGTMQGGTYGNEPISQISLGYETGGTNAEDNATLSATNTGTIESTSSINVPVAQISISGASFNYVDSYGYSIPSGLNVSATNEGSILGTLYPAAQLLVSLVPGTGSPGSSGAFNAGSNATFSLLNTYELSSQGHTGQIVVEAATNGIGNSYNAIFSAGDNSTFNINNQQSTIGQASMMNVLAGQILVYSDTLNSNTATPTGLFEVADNASFTLNNQLSGNILGSIATGQITVYGNGGVTIMEAQDNATFILNNQGGSTIAGDNFTAQLTIVGAFNYPATYTGDKIGTATFQVGDNATITFNNQNKSAINTAPESNEYTAGQLILAVDGGRGANFIAGDNANLILNNQDSTINNFQPYLSLFLGGAAGQIVLNANGDLPANYITIETVANFSVGNNADIALNNVDGGFIEGLGDTGQIVVNGFYDGITAQSSQFQAGNFANFTLNNSSTSDFFNPSTIFSVEGSAGQILLDGNSGNASFEVFDNATFTLSNQSASTIEGAINVGQLVIMDRAVFQTGDNPIFTLNNTGSSYISPSPYPYLDANDVGQIVLQTGFLTSNLFPLPGPASLETGDNAIFSLNNLDSSVIQNPSGVVGQIAIDGKGYDSFFSGAATFSNGDNASFTLNNGSNSSITNILPNSTPYGNVNLGQLVIFGEGVVGSAIFTANDNFSLTINNLNQSNIVAETTLGQGNIGQLVVGTNRLGSALFSAGENAAIHLNNEGGSSINGTALGDAGQIVVGAATITGGSVFSVESNASIIVNNQGNKSVTPDNDSPYLVLSTLSITGSNDVGQIVIDGSTVDGVAGDATFSIGNSVQFTLNNQDSAEISAVDSYDAGQLVIDGNLGSASLVIGENATVSINNLDGQISNTNSLGTTAHDVGQIVIDAHSIGGEASLRVGNNAKFTVDNSTDNNDSRSVIGCGGNIAGQGGNIAGQIVVDSALSTGEGALFEALDNATFLINNISSFLGPIIGNIETPKIAGQIVVSSLISNGSSINSVFSAGDNATFTLNNQDRGVISGQSDSGQIALVNDSSFTVRNNSIFNINNQDESSIGTLLDGGFSSLSAAPLNHAGQILIDTSQFVIGDDAVLVLKNQDAFIECAGDAGQLVVSSNQNIGSTFQTGKGTTLTLFNEGSSLIHSSSLDAGQIVAQSMGNTALIELGDYSTVNAYNNATISNSLRGNIVGQIVFDGATLEALGNFVTITATNQENGMIDNNNGPSVAGGQMVFNNATIIGAPTLVAINQAVAPNAPNGIVFSGTSTAPNTNVVLQNSSMLVAATPTLKLASVTGDANSTVTLTNSLEIDTVAGANSTFAGAISGAGGLTIGGAGIQTLTGASNYTGGTTVNSGTLVLDGSVQGDLTVYGGILSGSGSIGGNLRITTTGSSAGIIRPGDPLGTLSVGGNYTQDPGTTYIVAFDNQGLSSMIYVAGRATLNGGQVEALPLNLPPKPQAYRILCANGGIQGRFAGLTLVEPIGNYTAALAYDSCCVYLVTTGGCQTGCECFTPTFNIVVPAVTCNQIAVATVLESVSEPTADQMLLFLSLESLDTEDALKALNQMSGEQYTTLVTAAEIAGHQFVRRLYDPLRSIVTTEPCCNSCFCDPTLDLWLEASGGQSFIDGNVNCRGLKMTGWEITAGAQSTFACDWTVGGAISYAHDHVQYRIGGEGDNNTILAGLYGLYRPQGYYVLGDLVFGYSKDKVKRPTYVGPAFYESKSNPNVYQGIAYGEVGIDLDIGAALEF